MNKESYFVVIQGGHIESYALNDRAEWRIGRPTAENHPEIPLLVPTISRQHGVLKYDNGWRYRDGGGKNGTLYNERPLEKRHGRMKSFEIKDNDKFLFGSAGERVINSNTVFALYTECAAAGCWKSEDTAGYRRIVLNNGVRQYRFDRPTKGTVLTVGNEIAIYMGDITFLTGNLTVSGLM